MDTTALIYAFGKIRKRLGGLRYKQAVESIESGDLRNAISISLEYYDKAYKRSGESTRWINDVEFELAAAGEIETISKLQQLAIEIAAKV